MTRQPTGLDDSSTLKLAQRFDDRELAASVWLTLAEWATAGVFDQLHLKVLDRLGEQGELDWSR